MLEAVLDAIATAAQPASLLAIVVGTAIGVVIGALPGLTATMGMALLAPFTFFMPPTVGIAFLIGLYKGGTFGGSISAVLIGTPGTASNAATMLDGYAMAKKGEGPRALSVALWASVAGDLVGTIALVVGAPLLAAFALRFGSPEFFALTLFSLTLVCYVSGASLAKGLLAAAIGLVLALVGSDPIGGSPRFTFGVPDLSAGIGVIPLAIGLFGLTEVLVQLTGYRAQDTPQRFPPFAFSLRHTMAELARLPRTILRSAFIGSAIGALPGIGAETSNWVAYGMAKRASKTPERFGTGEIEGVVAPEVAANAVCGAAMVPMLVFGIPGDIVTAIMMGALIAQGLTPGPSLIADNPAIFYSLFVSMFFAMVALAGVGLVAVRYAGLILNTPKPILFSVVTVLCFAGTFAVNASLFDVGMMVAFGVLGWMMRQVGIPVAPLILAFILSRLVEDSLRRSLIQGDGSLMILVERPIALVILIATALMLVSIVLGARRARRAVTQGEDPSPQPSHR
jgi:putative tricarboxylic transport membrane protein